MIISLTIPDDIVTRVVDALCGLNGFDTDPDGLTKAQFAKRELLEYARSQVILWESNNVRVAQKQQTFDDTQAMMDANVG